MSAFGSGEDGQSWLDAYKEHCCNPDHGDDELFEVVKQARRAWRQAGRGSQGKVAAWKVLEDAGMEILPELMTEIGVARNHGPRAAFFSVKLGKTFVLTYTWAVERIDAP
jgi:hypothetical protein